MFCVDFDFDRRPGHRNGTTGLPDLVHSEVGAAAADRELRVTSLATRSSMPKTFRQNLMV